MSITADDIEKVAKLARIQINDDQVTDVTNSINDVLALIDKMQSVDTSHVEPLANPQDAVQTLRQDEVTAIEMDNGHHLVLFAGKRDFHHNAAIGYRAIAMRRTLGVITTNDPPLAFECCKARELRLCHLEGVGVCLPSSVTSGQAGQHCDEDSAA